MTEAAAGLPAVTECVMARTADALESATDHARVGLVEYRDHGARSPPAQSSPSPTTFDAEPPSHRIRRPPGVLHGQSG